jgi:SprT protein
LTRAELTEKIKKFIPEGTEDYVVHLLIQYKVQLRLSKPRRSKYGDYRSPHSKDNFHRISVNKDLNPYAFITTFLHEIAHLIAFEKFRNKIDPHGKEWKHEFKLLLEPLILHHQLPDDIRTALQLYMSDPKASSCSDKNLSKVMSRYDIDDKLLLEDIPEGSIFQIDSGKVFKKGKRLRTWIQCFLEPNGKEYKISGICKVKIIDASTDKI